MQRKNGSWSYNMCETCLKNSHEKVGMERHRITSIDTPENYEDMWCCPVCGSTKKL